MRISRNLETTSMNNPTALSETSELESNDGSRSEKEMYFDGEQNHGVEQMLLTEPSMK